MQRPVRFAQRIRHEEDGHVGVGVLGLVAAIGALALACGAADGPDWVAYLGGVLLAVGIMGASVARHRSIDYEVFDRLDKLEKR